MKKLIKNDKSSYKSRADISFSKKTIIKKPKNNDTSNERGDFVEKDGYFIWRSERSKSET